MAKVHNNIVDLPLRKYVEALVDKNLHALVIEGDPTREELEQAWQDVQSQYGDAMGDMEHKVYLKILKDVTILDADYKLIHLYVELLEKMYIQQVAIELNKLLKSSFVLDPKDPVKYRKELQSALNQSKSLKIKLDMKNIEFESIRTKYETDGVKPSKEYFQSILITLTDHSKVPLNDNMSVYEFCERMRRLNQYVDQQTKQFKDKNGSRS